MERVVAENGDVAQMVVMALCGGGQGGSLAKELREAIEAQQQLLDHVEREEGA